MRDLGRTGRASPWQERVGGRKTVTRNKQLTSEAYQGDVERSFVTGRQRQKEGEEDEAGKRRGLVKLCRKVQRCKIVIVRGIEARISDQSVEEVEAKQQVLS